MVYIVYYFIPYGNWEMIGVFKTLEGVYKHIETLVKENNYVKDNFNIEKHSFMD